MKVGIFSILRISMNARQSWDTGLYNRVYSLLTSQYLTERYPETLVEEFLTHGVEKDAKILDMACGPGNVAYIVRFLCWNVGMLNCKSWHCSVERPRLHQHRRPGPQPGPAGRCDGERSLPENLLLLRHPGHTYSSKSCSL